MDDQEKRKAKTSNPETDCWILLDSKSNPGRKYYYNPLTKQALWHHSDNEIARTKKKTITGSCNQAVDNYSNERHVEAIINKPAINSAYPSNSINIWEIPYMQSAVPLIQQSIPSAFINSPFLCNQIISAPTQSALINLQSGSLTINEMQNINRLPQHTESNCNEPTNSITDNYRSRNTLGCNKDLRNRLNLNRYKKKNNTQQFSMEDGNKNEPSNDEAVKQILTYLGGYAPPYTKSVCWYIVPDVLTVINHSRFLNQMTILDDKRCRLKIPTYVAMDLKNYEQRTGDEVVSRFMRFHYTEEDAEEINSKNITNKFKNIVNTCRKLSKDNYHVVLLCSSDKAFISFKKVLNIPVFTVDKIRELQLQGRLTRRNVNTLQKDPLDQNFCETNTESKSAIIKKEDIKNTETSLSNISSEPEGVTIEQDNKLDNETAEQINVKSQQISPIKSNLYSHPSNKKRIIRLRPASKENTASDQSSRRKRWSAFKNSNQESKSAECIPISSGNVADNVSKSVCDTLPKSNVKVRNYPIVKPLEKQDNSSSSKIIQVPLVTVVEDASTESTESKKVNSDRNNSSTIVQLEPTSGNIMDGGAKSDSRWMQKFMEIMENVLMGVLGQDSTTCAEEIPQLRRLHKAILGIIKKFSDRWLIVDAANKLSMKISQSYDLEGTKQFNQEFFNDIHVYGINLVEALQEISLSIADIQNAKRLLKNIRDDLPIFSEDLCNNILTSVTTDDLQGILEDDIKYKEDKIPTETNIGCITGEECASERIRRDDDDDDRPNKKSFEEKSEQEDIYFTALNLRKRVYEESLEDISDSDFLDTFDKEHKYECEISNTQVNQDNTVFNTQRKEEDILEDITDDTNEDSVQKDEPMNNFYETSCDELENTFDSKPEHGGIGDSANVSQDFPDGNVTNKLDNEKFKRFIGMFLKEIREALLVCAQNFEMCITHHNVINNDLSKKFDEVHTYLYNIQQSLDSILYRETDVNNNFKSLLMRAGVDLELDQSVCEEYRDIVKRCKNEVNAFLNILERKFVDQKCDVPLPSPQRILLRSQRQVLDGRRMVLRSDAKGAKCE